MSRTIELTRVWAAITGLALVTTMAVLVLLGHSMTMVLPMLIAGILGYEMAMTGYEFWRNRRHG